MSALPRSSADRIASLHVARDFAARGNTAVAFRLAIAVLVGGIEDLDVLHLAGVTLMAGGETDMARAVYQEVLRRDVTYIWSRIEIANLHYEAGRKAEAMAEYQHVVLSSNAPVFVSIRLAELLRDEGRPFDAFLMVMAALDTDPDNVEWLALKAELEAAAAE